MTPSGKPVQLTAFNGSARKGGDSSILLQRVFHDWTAKG